MHPAGMSLPLVPETGGRAEGQRAGAAEPAGHEGAPAAKEEAFPAPESGAARAPDGVTATLGEARGGVGTGEVREAARSGDRALRTAWPPGRRRRGRRPKRPGDLGSAWLHGTGGACSSGGRQRGSPAPRRCPEPFARHGSSNAGQREIPAPQQTLAFPLREIKTPGDCPQ